MLGSDIKRIRKLLGLNQFDFAQLFNVTQGYISRLEGEKDLIGEDFKTLIINYAHENNIDIGEDSFHEPAIHYDRQKKKEELDLSFINKSDKTLKISDYNASEKYEKGDQLTLKKVDRILLGREYVFYIKSDPVAYIGKFAAGTSGHYIIQVPGITEQQIPIDEIDSAYVITGVFKSNL